MMRHLTHDIGWRVLLVVAVGLALCTPALLAWLRHEFALWRRATRRARVVDARQHRFDSARLSEATTSPLPAERPSSGGVVEPSKASAVRHLSPATAEAPGSFADDPFLRSTRVVLDALDDVFIAARPKPRARW